MADSKTLVASVVSACRAFVSRELSKALERIEESIEKRLSEIPAGKEGAPGKDGIDGKDGRDGIDGKDGLDGKDGRDGIDGKDGEPGRDGEDGRDALEIEVLSMIDPEKRYRRGTYASHNGGLWRATKTTTGMDGWECIVSGIAAVEAVQDPEDPRTIALGIKTTAGQIIEKIFRMPVVVDKGVFREGTEYKKGDGVTWARHYWIAQQDTTEKPEPGPIWRLAVKGGRDGKDGRDGVDMTKPVNLRVES